MASFVPQYEKIVQSGDLIEIYEYEKAPPRAPIARHKRRKETWEDKLRRKNRTKSERHIKRAVFNFRRKVRSTLIYGTPHMFSLTMYEIVDIALAYKIYTQFCVRLRKVFGKEVIWITVPEFQKRGAVHFHCLVWDLPYDIHEIERDNRHIQHLWGYGYVDVIATNGSPKLSGYLAKYMSKAMYDDRLFGKKAYSCSRNALSPMFLKTKTQVAFLKEEFGIDMGEGSLQPTDDKEYTTKWLGRVHYRKYENTIDKKL